MSITPAGKRIIAYLEEHPMSTIPEIIAGSGMKHNTVYVTVNRLVAEGHIHHPGFGEQPVKRSYPPKAYMAGPGPNVERKKVTRRQTAERQNRWHREQYRRDRARKLAQTLGPFAVAATQVMR